MFTIHEKIKIGGANVRSSAPARHATTPASAAGSPSLAEAPAITLQIGAALGYGAAVAWTCKLGGWLEEPVSLTCLQQSSLAGDTDPHALGPWLVGTAISLLVTYAILVALLVLNWESRLRVRDSETSIWVAVKPFASVMISM